MASRSMLLVFLGFLCLHGASAKTYTVIVSTGFTGTTDKVSIILVGQRGQTRVHDLAGAFGRNSDRVFNDVNDKVDVGKITEVKIRLQKTKQYKDYWLLKQVTVMMSPSEIYVFYYNKEVTYNQWNSIGTKCKPGFTQTSSGCVDIDECKDPNTCQDIATCNNNIGSYNCLCPKGYNTNYLKKCIDVNECILGNGGCEEYCYNTAGSFHCGCSKSGYKVVDGYRCVDIDECLEGKDNCDTATTTCKNHDGTFACDCKPGYTWKDYTSCQRGTCTHFKSNRDSRGKLEPARCHEQGKNKFEDQCKVVCNHGYVPEDPARTNSTCRTDLYWKPYPTHCTGRSCSLLTSPSNGRVMERCRISVVKFGDSECEYSCNDKYRLNGNKNRKCQSDGTWSGTQPTCERVYKKPDISCPANINMNLLPGMNTSDISAQWSRPWANVKNVTAVDPPGVSSSYRFPFGRTIIKWMAMNEIGEQDYCEVLVEVTDAEKPKIVSCPGPTYKVSFNTPLMVDIPRPVFSDNVGIVKYQPPLEDRKKLYYGNNNLTYRATDASGNFVECTIVVVVGGYRCQVPPEGPSGGEWICPKFAITPYCIRKCPKGKKVFGPSGFWFCVDSIDGIWKQSEKPGPVPDCVGYTDVNASVPCSVGTVRNTTLGFNGCYECPLGTHYDNGSCVKCAEGDFQDLRGQTSCKPCPAGTSSAAGAYSCRPICPPGRYSKDGLGPFCDFCANDTFQDKQQQTGCVACPNGTYTLHIGATFCGNSPQITKLEPGNAASVNAGGTVVLKCYSQGTPTPSVYWQYTDSGKSSKIQQQMKDKDGNPTGTQLTITNADSADDGTYKCISANAHAEVSDSLQLTVKPSSVKRSSKERTKSMLAMDNLMARAKDQCPSGFFSSDGLGPLCRVCSKNSYQDQTGQTTCKQCTSGTTTLQLAAPSSAACGVAPVITSMNTSHGNFSSSIKEVTLDCYATGSPLPLVMWRFTKDIPKEFLGLPKLEQLLDFNGKPIGTRMVIKAPTDYNTGQYECTAVNTHGQDEKSVHLQVNFRQNK